MKPLNGKLHYADTNISRVLTDSEKKNESLGAPHLDWRRSVAAATLTRPTYISSGGAGRLNRPAAAAAMPAPAPPARSWPPQLAAP